MKKLIAIIICFSLFLSSNSLALPFGSQIIELPKQLQNSTRGQEFFIPEQYGAIQASSFAGQPFLGKEDKNSPGSPLIILIKDAHCHYEAQHNIAKILNFLQIEYGVDTLALEGAAGKLDYSLYGKFKDKEAKEKVLDTLVKEGYVSGPEYLGITSYHESPFSIYGIENTGLYGKNFKGLQETINEGKDLKPFLKYLEGIITNLKEKVYGKSLKLFDEKAERYKNNPFLFLEWLKELVKYANKLDITINGDNILLTQQLLSLEKNLDLNKVEKERNSLINDFVRKHSKKELALLIEKSLLFQQKKISAVHYYTDLNQHNTKNIYPQLAKYCQMLKLKEKIDKEQLFLEVEKLENQIKESLFKNDRERELDKLSYRLTILRQLLKVELTRKQFFYFENHQDEFASQKLLVDIKKQANLAKINILPLSQEKIILNGLKNFIAAGRNFYQIALKRDKLLLKNTLKVMAKEAKNKAVMVVGGFHMPGIITELKKKNINYVVISPQISAVKATPYLQVMLNKKISVKSSGMNLAVPKFLAMGKESIEFFKVIGAEAEVAKFKQKVLTELNKTSSKDEELTDTHLENKYVYLAEPGSRTTRLHYQIGGNKESLVTLIFLHGFTNDLKVWEKQIAAFGKKYKVLLLDARGHGKSGLGSAPMGMETFTHDVERILEKEELSQGVLIGHSMGGMTSLNVKEVWKNLEQNKRIDGIALITSSAESPDESFLAFDSFIIKGIAKALLMAPMPPSPMQFSHGRIGEQILKQILKIKPLREAIASIASTLGIQPKPGDKSVVYGYIDNQLAILPHVRSLLYGIKSMFKHNVVKKFPELAVPLLWFVGGKDRVIVPKIQIKQFGKLRRALKKGKNSEVLQIIFPEGAHYVGQTRYDIVNQAIDTYVKTLVMPRILYRKLLEINSLELSPEAWLAELEKLGSDFKEIPCGFIEKNTLASLVKKLTELSNKKLESVKEDIKTLLRTDVGLEIRSILTEVFARVVAESKLSVDILKEVNQIIALAA
ncbi:alpha/beta fold hydrolase [Candidatus Auribacterota bacterium]